MNRFADLKNGFGQIFADPHWFVKVLLGGCLLINPLLIALVAAFFDGSAKPWARISFPWVLGLNILTFCFPLGFTFEVLRRARTGQRSQLPDWRWDLLPRYACEGVVKLVLACSTLLLPVGLWVGLVHLVFVRAMGLPPFLMPLFIGPILWLVIPFCCVACCRWIDGIPILHCALNYSENWRLFRKGLPDYLLASTFLIGVNVITASFFYTIPFAAIFGLCLVDTWFGPIYAETAYSSSKSKE